MPLCPQCGNNGTKVKHVTLESLLRPERREDIGDEPYHVCLTPKCDTVYFGADGASAFSKADLSTRFGLKETTPPRPVCYCFDHTIEEIEDEVARTGRSTVAESIKSEMQGPGCRCEYTNPFGRCCLNTVQAVVAAAMRSSGYEPEAVPTEVVDCCAETETSSYYDTTVGSCTTAETSPTQTAAATDCCQRSGEPPELRSGDRAGALATGGSVVAAVLSSACCWVPLVLVAFGASAAGVAGFFETYRTYFIVGAVVLLGFGFYMVYFPKKQCEPGSACTTPNQKVKRLNRVMVWTATVLVTGFVLFPNYVGFVLGSPNQRSAKVGATGLASAKFHIEGMTCEGCAGVLHSTLTKLPGVRAAEVDFATKSAVIQYEPANPTPPETVIEAVKGAGYSATRGGGSP